MRAHEFITEGKGKRGKMPGHAQQASRGVFKVRDEGGYDRTYHMNRLWMAMAMADGKSQDAVDMDYESFAEKYNTVHPYTEEEYNMLIAATKTVPTDRKNVLPYSKSMEPEDTNVKSAVVAFKGYGK
jgi:hypothetical protein